MFSRILSAVLSSWSTLTRLASPVFAPVVSFLKQSKNDLIRLIVFTGLAVLMFYPDYTLIQTARYVFGFLACIALFSHVTRRLLFPYVDLGSFFEEAKRGNVAAALVVLGICVILAVTFIVAGSFFAQ